VLNYSLLDNASAPDVFSTAGSEELEELNYAQRLKLCKSQHPTLALDLSLWKIGNPNAVGATKPANDLRWASVSVFPLPHCYC
jgi:hypothetical protein